MVCIVMMSASTSFIIASLLALLHPYYPCDAFNLPSRRLKPSYPSPLLTSTSAAGCTAAAAARRPSHAHAHHCHCSSLFMSGSTDTSTSYSSSSVYAKVITGQQQQQQQQQQSIDRSTAQTIVDQTLCPKNEERDRNTAAMEAYQGTTTSGSSTGTGTAISNDDPRSEYTYGEFPYESFDLLVDRALDFVNTAADTNNDHDDADGNNQSQSQSKQTLLDLGSGSGRLVFYAALTRGGNQGEFDVHGVEISTQFMKLASNSLQRGVDNGWFVPSDSSFESKEDDNDDDGQTTTATTIALHNGNALLVDDPYYNLPTAVGEDETTTTSTHSTIQSLLSKTNILFAYSTVWETNSIQPFNPELGCLILSPKWSSTLAEVCSNGCVAITTDRALNPQDGWRLVDRMDVENPSVWGSVGYVSVLEK